MKKITFIIIFICKFWLLSYTQTTDNVYSGIIQVKLKSHSNALFLKANNVVRTKAIQANSGETIKMGIKSIDALNTAFKASSIKRVFPYAANYEAKHEKYGLHLWYYIEVDNVRSSVEIANQYNEDPNIEVAQPVYKINIVDSKFDDEGENSANRTVNSESLVPDDPYFIKQWHYKNTGQSGGQAGIDIRLEGAWAISTGNPNVIVAVVDGGIDTNHVDLRGNLWKDRGYNFVIGQEGNLITPSSHGTHVAGTVAALNNNGEGVCGVAGGFGPQKGAQLMSCQIFTDTKEDQGNSAAAFVFGADNGAVIAQNSWGFGSEVTEAYFLRTAVREAIDYFIAEAGKDENGNPRLGTPMVGGIVIFAAGNESSSGDWYPARYEKVLSVASVNHSGRLAYYSNYGDWVDISATGGETTTNSGGVYSTIPGNKYGYMQGTSMASPHVSGVAALVLSKYGNSTYTPEMLKNRLLSTVTSLEEYEPSYYLQMGTGLLNAEKALQPNNGIGPDAITDLSYSNVRSTSAVINWTAPADDDNGNAKSYQIAISDNAISSVNDFEAAIAYTMDKAQIAGSKEVFNIIQLLPSTQYYVAIRSLDLWENKSDISNVINFKTVDNRLPVAVAINPMSIRDIGGKKEIILTEIFSDPDEDILIYEVNNPNLSVAKAEVVADKLIITPVVAGEVNFKITATDPFGLKASEVLKLTVTKNQPPTPIFVDTTLIMNAKDVKTFDLTKYFADPEGDPISYSVVPTIEGVVNTSLSGSSLTLTAVKKGSTTIHVIATDKYLAEGRLTMSASVNHLAPDNSNEILVYPIPMYSTLNYAFMLDVASDVEIRIFGVDGRLIYHQPRRLYQIGSHSSSIDVSSWAKGMYVIQYLVNGKSVDTKKVVK